MRLAVVRISGFAATCPSAGAVVVPNNLEEKVMAVARVTKITAASGQGFQQAAENGLKRATKSLRGVTGFEVVSLKGKVEKDKVTEYRVTLEVTFILE